MRVYPIIILLVLIISASAQDMPSLVPEAYWGTALVDGIPAPVDSEITAEIQETGEVVGRTLVIGDKGLYSLDVIFDNDLTEEDEGAGVGQLLLWRINGIACDTPAPGADLANSGSVNANFTLSAGGKTTTSVATTVKPAQGSACGANSGLIWPVLVGLLVIAAILYLTVRQRRKK